MSSFRPRGPSPPRHPGDSRATAGAVFSTGFDTRFGPSHRSDYDAWAPRHLGAGRPYDAQPISKKNYSATAHAPAQSKTEYLIRPRNNPTADDDGRTPLRIMAPPMSPTRNRATDRDFERPRSPVARGYYLPDGNDHYIMPAVSGSRSHRRQVSASPADSSHLFPSGREYREHRGYLLPGNRPYRGNEAPVRYSGEDDYSYTNPREQFDRDYPPPQPRPPRNSYLRNSRPTSTSEFDDWKTLARQQGDGREGERDRVRDRGPEFGPPPATRQFDRIDTEDPRRHGGYSGNYSDMEQDVDGPRRRHSTRAPVAVHQVRGRGYSPASEDRQPRRHSQHRSRVVKDEPSYSSDRENSHPSRHYERHLHRPRGAEEGREQPSKKQGVVAVGLSGLAAAGLTNALVKKPKDDEGFDRDDPYIAGNRRLAEKEKERAHGHRDRDRLPDKLQEPVSDRREEISSRDHHKGTGKSERPMGDDVDVQNREGPSENHHRRRKKRHHHHHHELRPQDKDSDSPSDDPKRIRRPKDHGQALAERDSGLSDSDTPRRDRGPLTLQPRPPSEDRRRPSPALDSGRNDDQTDGSKRLQLVEASADPSPELKPKGILKPARQVPFPEDPNPTREGVAPLRDAGKQGIPPDARWTKINRKLVNPAALEAAHERYEERDEYVIVLRVLSKEEIEKFAEITSKIREARELEWQEQQHERRRRRRSRLDDVDRSDEERKPPLAIEAPPPSGPEMRQHQVQQNVGPVPDTGAMAGLGIRA